MIYESSKLLKDSCICCSRPEQDHAERVRHHGGPLRGKADNCPLQVGGCIC